MKRLVIAVSLVCLGCRPSQPEQRAPLPSTTPVSPATQKAPPPAPAPVAAPRPAAEPSAAPEPEESPPVRRFTHQSRDRDTTGQQRVDQAEQNKTEIVKSLFRDAGVKWPPRQLLMRVFKKENRLEMWAADALRGPLTHVTTYEICYASGDLGPKRQEGDRQVPEGFYKISWFKSKSDYHMAMQVSYPNASDRVFGHPKHPGGEIMIHGACVSVGCLAMSDERIEEIWVIARAAPAPVDVHIFPTRDMESLVATDSPHRDFWTRIKVGFDRFEANHTRFGVRVKRDGHYELYDL